MGFFSSPRKKKMTLSSINSKIAKEEKKFALKQAKVKLSNAKKKNRGF